jgi:hypothetical protein
MVCSHCNCSGHYKTTCPTRVSLSEARVVSELVALLPPVLEKESSQRLVATDPPHMAWMRGFARMLPFTKKTTKTLVGLAGCKNIFKEPNVVKVKKTTKTLVGLAGCKNIFKEPKVVKVKKTTKTLVGLAGCKNIFKEPKVVKVKKTTKTCSACGEKGHNSRTCQICLPCPSPKYYCFTGLSAKQAVTMARVMGCTPAIN